MILTLSIVLLLTCLILKICQSCLQELIKSILKILLISIDLLSKTFHHLKEGMDVQSRSVMFPLRVLEADIEVCLEELVDLAELGHS